MVKWIDDLSGFALDTSKLFEWIRFENMRNQNLDHWTLVISTNVISVVLFLYIYILMYIDSSNYLDSREFYSAFFTQLSILIEGKMKKKNSLFFIYTIFTVEFFFSFI